MLDVQHQNEYRTFIAQLLLLQLESSVSVIVYFDKKKVFKTEKKNEDIVVRDFRI